MNAARPSLLAAALWLASAVPASAFDSKGYDARFVTDAPAPVALPDDGGSVDAVALPDAVLPPGEFVLPDDGGEAAAMRLLLEAQALEAEASATEAAEPPPSAPPADEPVALPAPGESNDEEAPASGSLSALVPTYVDPAVTEAEEQRREALRALRGPYVGITGGTDNVAISQADDGTSHGMLIGYRIDEILAAELVLTRASYVVATTPPLGCSLDNLSQALYMVARSEDGLYGKAKLGILSESLDSAGGCAGTASEDVGLSAGLGAGVRLGKAVAIELEYTFVEKDIYRLGWTLLFHF